MHAAIREGADPSVLGRAAHKVDDCVKLDDGGFGVWTPTRGWHRARTPREQKLARIMWYSRGI